MFIPQNTVHVFRNCHYTATLQQYTVQDAFTDCNTDKLVDWTKL